MDFTNPNVINVIIQQLENYSNEPSNNLDNLESHLKQIVSIAQSNLTYRCPNWYIII